MNTPHQEAYSQNRDRKRANEANTLHRLLFTTLLAVCSSISIAESVHSTPITVKSSVGKGSGEIIQNQFILTSHTIPRNTLQTLTSKGIARRFGGQNLQFTINGNRTCMYESMVSIPIRYQHELRVKYGITIATSSEGYGVSFPHTSSTIEELQRNRYSFQIYNIHTGRVTGIQSIIAGNSGSHILARSFNGMYNYSIGIIVGSTPQSVLFYNFGSKRFEIYLIQNLPQAPFYKLKKAPTQTC